jgi:hypothetical protein
VVAGHVQGQRLRVGELFAAQVAKLVSVKYPDVSGQGLVRPAHPLATLFRAGNKVLAVRSLVEDPNCGVGKGLATLLAG